MSNKNCICIDTDKLSIKNFHKYLKGYILDGLENKEKFLIVMDTIYCNELKKIFKNDLEYLYENIDNENIFISIYDSNNIRFENFLHILKQVHNTKNTYRILWDFKNMFKSEYMFKESLECIKKICKYFNKRNIKNLVYMNNINYDMESLKEFCKEFNKLIVFDKGEKLNFEKNEMEKAIHLLQSYEEAKGYNDKLILFNESIYNISKKFHSDSFKNDLIDKLIDLCKLNFCIMYTYESENENVVCTRSYFGITKKHRYYLINDSEVISLRKIYNKKIMSTNKVMLLEVDKLKDLTLKRKLMEVDVISLLGISVQYNEGVNGVIWVGSYKSNNKIFKESIKYIESICKIVFYLIMEQQKFLQLKGKFIENEKFKNIGEISAGIAHDINNVLTPVIGAVQLLKDKYNEDNTIIKQLNIIEMCAYDVNKITNKVKSLTEDNNMDKVEVFNIDKIIVDAIELTQNRCLTQSMINGFKINVVKILDASSKVKCNSTELREVFINIISNSIDAMPQGGKIEILSSEIDDYVIVQIRDNGIGMNEDVHKKIFEPFFTTKGNKGSGLGLSISYKIIKSFGGSIEVESEENIGTLFKIKLPICEDEKKNECVFEKEKDVHFSGNILLIDDKENIRNVVADMIKSVAKCKIKKIEAKCIEQVEEELKHRKYDIVISDFSMPNVNGLEVAECVKKVSKTTYFCLMTGWIGTFTNNYMKNIDKILYKPINKEQVTNLLIEFENTIN